MSINTKDMALQDAKCQTLTNGVKLYTLNSNEFEVLRVSFVFEAGTSVQKYPFSASAAANMLCEGSETMTAQQIAERLDYYGSYFDVNIDRDNVYVNFCSLSKFVNQTLDVVEQIILHPTFPEHEVQNYRTKRKQRLTIEREKVETKAREEFARSLFGEQHPYSISHHESEYDNLTRDKIVDIYNRFYRAEGCFVVCSGRINQSELDRIVEVASAIPTGGERSNKEFPEAKPRPFHIVKCEDAVQSSIRIGRKLFSRSHPDFIGMQILSTVLGGYFGSRLMQQLRERRGMTYGVMSTMVTFARDGYFAIATQVGVESTHEAIEIIMEEVERLRTELISEDELGMVKQIMAGEIMRILDGPFGIADVTIENILCGCDNSIILSNARRIEAYTPADLLSLAQRHLNPKEMVCVVAGRID